MENPTTSITERLTTSINLKDDSRHQFLLASQNYETFYCIYAKFNFKTPGQQIIDDIELKIQNYKGACNIGFVSQNGSNNITINVINNELIINIPVIGFSDNFTTNIDKSNTAYNTEIDLSGITNVTVYRGLIKSDTSNKGIYDTEFNYRDGVDEYGMYSNSLSIPPGMFLNMSDWNYFTLNSIPRATGGNCFTSNLVAVP